HTGAANRRRRGTSVRGASAPLTLRRTLFRMLELYGDSARGADWAAVRLRVRDGRIVDADVSGLDADLRGLTLLEAAAVGGETLPVDALANALAPAVRAPRDARRTAVAMSGGVDSAVALLRAGELLAFADRVGAARLATGHYARVVERGGRRLLARATDPAKDQSYMLARLDPQLLDRVWFPLGEQGKEETRAEAAAAGLAVAQRADSQEACFLAGDDYRAFLGRQGLAVADGPIVDEEGNELGRHDGFWRFTAGQRRGLGVAAAAPLYAVRTEPRTNT